MGGGKPRVLVVDDAEGVRGYVASVLELRGWAVDTAEDGRRALALVKGGAAPDVVLLDVLMPGTDGVDTLRQLRELHPQLPVVMLSVVGKAATIVECMRHGAAGYVNKPFDEDEFESVLRDVLDTRALELERERLGAGDVDLAAAAVWASEPMRRVRDLLVHVADTDVTVLIQGESGTGKEIVARTLHSVSSRASAAFVKVNCAALPADLLESEMFGYEKGAFTGAFSRKQGKFELAHRGTIFLDEIGEMSAGLQAKLLQVLQDDSFTRLGGNQEIHVDARVVCATNRRLDEMVQEGTFREDLFFRLNVVNVALPPLRDRREELPRLVDAFAERFSGRYARRPWRPGPEIMRAFESYPFPGNVRELENMVQRIVVLENEQPVLDEIADYARGERGTSRLRQVIEELEAMAGQISLREVARQVALQAEREAIDRVLQSTHWNRKQAARLLGVSYKTLLHKIRDTGLEPE